MKATNDEWAEIARLYADEDVRGYTDEGATIPWWSWAVVLLSLTVIGWTLLVAGVS